MLSIISGLIYFFANWQIWRRYPHVVLAAFFLFFSFAMRVLGTLYLDLFGPVYAIELEYEVGGQTSTPLFVVTALVPILAVVLLCARLRLKQEAIGATIFGLPRRAIANIAFSFSILWLVALVIELMSTGTIPLLAGMDRLEYISQFKVPFYQFNYDMIFVVSFTLGFFFVFPRFSEGKFDYRFFYLQLCHLGYFAATGNRFSIFLVEIAYFLLPFAGVLAVKNDRALIAPDRNSGAMHRLLTNPAGRTLGLATGVLVVGALILNSFFNVRYDDKSRAQDVLSQRIFVQPTELYAVTWDRIVKNEVDTGLAYDLMFGNPIDPTRNTGIQFLMVSALGEQRATEILDQTAQFAGGYPEVLLELFGPAFATVPIIAAALILAMLVRIMIRSTIYGRFFTFLIAGYILYGFLLIYIGGMLNFLLAWTFWVKIGALLAALIIEPFLMRQPRMRRIDSEIVPEHGAIVQQSEERWIGA